MGEERTLMHYRFILLLTSLLSVFVFAAAAQPCAEQDTSEQFVGLCSGESFIYNGQTINAPGDYEFVFTGTDGCDSLVLLFVVDFHFSITKQSICAGDSIIWGGEWRTTEGFYIDTVFSGGQCDSLAFLELSILEGTHTEINAYVCSGDSVQYNGVWYFAGDSSVTVYTSQSGCDSVVRYLVSSYPTTPGTFFALNICQGDSVFFGGNWIKFPGVFSFITSNQYGCDSISVLTLTVNPYIAANQNAFICEGDSFLWYGTYYYSTGQYNRILPNANATGCDSLITLHLQSYQTYLFQDTVSICPNDFVVFHGQPVSSPGFYTHTYTSVDGCDSVRSLQLFVKPSFTSVISATICQGSIYNFAGNAYTSTGSYSNTFTASNGCDSVVTLQLTVTQPAAVSILDTICSGQQYNFNGNLLSNTGTYTQTLSTANGCDSVVTLQLTVTQPITIPQQATICSGQQYSFYGNTLTASGNYTHIISHGTGCDTTITLQLTVTDTLFTYTAASVCSGQSYNFYGSPLAMAGTYEQYFTSTAGCDSVVVLELTQHPTFNITTQQTICQGQSINFFGNTLNTSGTYTHNGATVYGCDSVVTLQLTVADTFKTTVSQNFCYDGFYSFFGQQLISSGTYYYTLQSTNGCDSLIELQLTMDTQIVTNIFATICSNTSYNFFGTTYNTPGIYGFALVSSAGCDSIVRLHLSVNQPSAITNLTAQICSGSSYAFAGNLLTQAGSYTHTYLNSVGCDSVVNLTLTVNDSVVTSQQAFICLGDTFDFYGTPLWFSGVFNKYLTTTAGCDSVIRLNLGVLATPLTSVSESICKGSSYSFFGSVLTQAGVYQHKIPVGGQCDSVIELTLTLKDTLATTTSASICANQSYNFYGTLLTAAGSYSQVLASSNGCDSTIYLTLSVNPVLQQTIDTSILSGSNYTLPGGGVVNTAGTYKDTLSAVSGCDSIVTTNLSVIIGVNDVVTGYACSVYPNPANEQLNVVVNSIKNVQATIALTDLSGRVVQLVYEGELTVGKNEWILHVSHLAAGAYLLRMNEQTVRVAVVH